MRKKIDLSYIYHRTRNLLIKPREEWTGIQEENDSVKEVFRFYGIPLCALSSLPVVLLSAFQYTPIQAFFYTLTNFISLTAGIYLAFWISREYLNGKTRSFEKKALHLIFYSSSVFVVFHSLAVALINGFFSQLAGLVSLIFLRTLYIGIQGLPELLPNQKTNLLIISALSILCLPVILKKFLMIVFHIPVFNV